jgi:hypothetical protein
VLGLLLLALALAFQILTRPEQVVSPVLLMLEQPQHSLLQENSLVATQ